MGQTPSDSCNSRTVLLMNCVTVPHSGNPCCNSRPTIWYSIILYIHEEIHVRNDSLIQLPQAFHGFLVLFSRLLCVSWFVLPTIYEEMWTEIILTEIKNNNMKSYITAATLSLLWLLWLLLWRPCCSAAWVLYDQTIRSHLNLTMILFFVHECMLELTHVGHVFYKLNLQLRYNFILFLRVFAK